MVGLGVDVQKVIVWFALWIVFAIWKIECRIQEVFNLEIDLDGDLI